MFRLVDGGPDASRIEFRPRRSFKDAPTVWRDLLYGYQCAVCGNVVQALFMTDKELNLEPYEETRVLSQGEKNGGDLLRIIPNREETQTGYNRWFFATANGNAQLIQLKNHVIRWKGAAAVADRDNFFEVGERCCFLSGIVSRRVEDIVRDLCLVAGFNPHLSKREDKTHPTFSFFVEWLQEAPIALGAGLRIIDAVGKAPPMLMLSRDSVKAGFSGTAVNLYAAWDRRLEQETQTPDIEED